MTTEELAQLDLQVAKAIGCNDIRIYPDPRPLCVIDASTISARAYSPSSDIAEAMRLAAKFEIDISWTEIDVTATVWHGSAPRTHKDERYADHSDNKLRACCVAICKAIVAMKP